jgi:predicted phosphodiesterase
MLVGLWIRLSLLRFFARKSAKLDVSAWGNWMSLSFVHLSDIHFGQEKTEGRRITHNDAKGRLIADAQRQAKDLVIEGIIVTGDVAYAGKDEEFKEAGAWLDELANAVGCKRTAVQVVPGNHDIDRSQISAGSMLMIDKVKKDGEDHLDLYLDDDGDCESLYRKLTAYLSFAEGYNCVLDKKGGIASNKTYELAPNRSLRFVGLNSALMCYAKEQEGDLVLGAKQRVLQNKVGEELVVLCHHPLHWFQDSEKARNYIRNRARVLMTGHEHKPSVSVEKVKEGRDILYLASGAAVPPVADDEFRYTYNILTFEWDPVQDALSIEIQPRTWSDSEMDFVADTELLVGGASTIRLASPNFRDAAVNLDASDEPAAPVDEIAGVPDRIDIVEESKVPDRFAMVLLSFFRDLTPVQRLEILVRLDALPPDMPGKMTLAMERLLVDKLVRDGRIAKLENEIVKANGGAGR